MSLAPAHAPAGSPSSRAPPFALYEHRTGSASRLLARPYQRRRPEQSMLYQLVERELPGLLADLAAASPYGTSLPRHVEKELRAFLECGRLEHGFARVVCKVCRHEHLVAFSCKGRGVCPSCATRRMHDTAAHLVDRVIPRVPVRQWVVTFPQRVRYHLAADPRLAADAFTCVLRVIAAFHRRRARRLGVRPTRASSTAAVLFVQRFNSALALSLHGHTLVPDGVFLPRPGDPDGRPGFVELPPPTDAEVASLLSRIVRRVTALLRRRGRLEDDFAEEPDQLLLFAGRSPVARAASAPEEKLPRLCARQAGFSLHAGSAVHANDRAGLEALCRYGLRPPLAQSRLALDGAGQVLYTMKRVFADGTHTLRFAPRDFLLRLAALVPPRGFHTVRYHGLFAAHARGRRALTGRQAPTGRHDCDHERGNGHDSPGSAGSGRAGAGAATPSPASASAAPPPVTSPPAAPAAALRGSSEQAVDPCIPEHCDVTTVVGPDDPQRPRRLAWAALLKRAWRIDALRCARCGGELALIAVILDPEVAGKILHHLGLVPRAPPPAHARDEPDPDYLD